MNLSSKLQQFQRSTGALQVYKRRPEERHPLDEHFDKHRQFYEARLKKPLCFDDLVHFWQGKVNVNLKIVKMTDVLKIADSILTVE